MKSKKNYKKIIFIIFMSILLIAVIILGLLFFPIVKFELKGAKVVTIEYGTKYEEEGFVAKLNFFDNRKKVIISDGIDYDEVGSYKILYEISLPLNKTKKIERTINIVDTVSPTIKLLGNNPLRISYNGKFSEPGYEISDNYDSSDNLKVKIIHDKEINTKEDGTYTISYEVTDTNGNITTITREVTVLPRIVTENGLTYVDGVLIVNKKYSLPNTYNPGENKEAYSWLQKMQNEATKHGCKLSFVSGFRSYYDQQYIYNNYVKEFGKELTDTFSARPGHSEHQTGLAFDVGWIGDGFALTESGKWLASNAHNYGFIIRYPKDKESITGYKYEPWHIRYLGIELATKVYNSGLSLEEYLGIN